MDGHIYVRKNVGRKGQPVFSSSNDLEIRMQDRDRALPAADSKPSVIAADWDGDGRAEIFMLSTDERQVGITQLDQKGRIAFPNVCMAGTSAFRLEKIAADPSATS
jgi:hypothetical protein